ncbi:MAG: GntR family transcriptional regulator [Ancalomicrobiaceae bacterium]|nr:GntR family transcriptional regulator [Ancalomicrobiaceae bacterium]
MHREDLVQRVANAMREQIFSGQLAAGSKLIPEAELARQIGISRPSLREAIRILAREGLISVKHGVGTFVSKETKPLLGSLELMRSMVDMIKQAGGEPACSDLSITRIDPPVAVAQELELARNETVGLISRVRLFNNTPFVVAREYVVLGAEPRSFETLSRFGGTSLYEFLRQEFGLAISHSKARLTAVASDAAMAKVLNLKKGAPLLLMHETHYGFDGKPVLLAVNCHNTEVIEFTSMRSGMPL